MAMTPPSAPVRSAPTKNRKQRRAAAARQAAAEAHFPEAWRTAIADQLLEGHTPQAIIEGLVRAGAAAAQARAEVAAAQKHPYLKNLPAVQAKLRKRDWLLDIYAAHWRMDQGDRLGVPRRSGVSGDVFLRDHYAAHRPVILTDAAKDWPAMTRWSLDYFEELAGDASVDVQSGREAGEDYEYNREKYVRTERFSTVLSWLRDGRVTNDYYLTANNTGRNRKALAPLWDDVSRVSEYLSDDGYSDGFFWLGPKGTITPYHHDLTNNLLVQVMGRKRVRLAPSFEIARMRNWRHCYSRWTGPDLRPGSGGGDQPAIVECVIGPGEGLFIPVGWWHWVEGLDVTAGMSFTNFRWPNAFYEGYASYGDL